MIEKNQIMRIIETYDLDKLAIATVCSHSSLQIFDGARKEGFKTIGICVKKPPKFYGFIIHHEFQKINIIDPRGSKKVRGSRAADSRACGAC